MKKRTILLFTLMITLLLGSCAGGGIAERQAMMAIRNYYLNQTNISFTAKLTADYGGRVYNYRLSYSGDGTRGELTVLEPVNIKGIVANVDNGSATLKYDGALIDTGAISSGGISPIAAFPTLIGAWKKGYIVSVWREVYDSTDCLCAEIRLDDNSLINKTWFDPATSLPVHAEIFENGYCVIICNFET